MDEDTFESGTTPPKNEFDSTSERTAERVEDVAKRTVLAGIGAVATAFDEANEKLEQFVDRGKQVRDEWQSKAEEVRQQNAGTRYRVRSYLRDAMDVFLNTMNVPSKGDIDTINVKLNILSRKLDEMNTGRIDREIVVPPSEPAVAPPPPPDDLST